jgi:Cu+-exporting ATPase
MSEEQVSLLEEIQQEEIELNRSEKSSCCKSKACSSKNDNEQKAVKSEEMVTPKQTSSCCKSNSCSKKLNVVEAVNKSEEVPIIQQTSSCCTSGKSCSKNIQTMEIHASNEKSACSQSDNNFKQEAPRSSCCKSKTCSKNNNDQLESMSFVTNSEQLEAVSFISNTEVKSEEVVMPKQTSSCCKSKSCSQKSNDQQSVSSNTPEVPKQQISGCCSGGSCSKSSQKNDNAQFEAVLSFLNKNEEMPKQPSSCCKSTTCSKNSNDQLEAVSFIRASEELVSKQTSSCCKSKSCSKKSNDNELLEMKSEELVPKQTSISCCSGGSCSKSSKKDILENESTDVKSSCCKSNSCGKQKKQSTDNTETSLLDINNDNHTILNLSVQQLHCSDCATMVEETLAKKPGVIHVRVMEMTNSARVVYDETLLEESAIIAWIEKLGFPTKVEVPASSTSVSFYLEQTLQQRQVMDLENMLEESSGVSSASYDFKKRVLAIEYDPDVTGVRSLKNHINREGYDVTIHSDRTVKSSSQSELRIWKRNVLCCLGLSTPVMIIAFIVPMITRLHELLNQQIIQGVSISVLACWIFATPIQFYFGKPLYLSAYRALRYAKKPNMDTLVMLSTTTAYVYSVISTIVAMFNKNYKAEAFFEASALLLTFIILGRFLEVLAKGQTSNILAKMMELRVTSALWLHSEDEQPGNEVQLITQGESLIEEEIDINFVQRGDVLKVLPGSKVPTDGIVVFGSTSIDESMLSGESLPVSKQVNDPVYGSTINQNGTIYVRVTKIASENTLSAIDKLIHESQTSKVPIQRVADTVSAYFVPIIMIISILAFILWLSLVYGKVLKTDVHPVTFALQFALAILVISCPCAISLAAPTAVMVGIGVGAKFGVLFKSGAVIETCHKVNSIIFDKTGTLTNGKPVVTDCIIIDNKFDMKTLLGFIGSAELGSEHVLGKAIVEHAQNQGVNIEQPINFTAEPGKGLTCSVQNNDVLAGNSIWMQENSVPVLSNVEYQIAQLEREGKTVISVAINGALAGIIALADTPKEEAELVVQELKRRGIEVWVVSGDNQTTTECIAAQIGIDNVMGGVLPADKAAKVRELQRNNKIVAMVGDGINDSPSLAQANVGIAIGAGSDIALETADIILVKSDLRDVLVAVDLSQTTFRRIKMNFVWAFLYNAIGIPLAAGALYPALKITIPPALAGLSEIFSSLPVVLFSLLLKTYRPKIYN